MVKKPEKHSKNELKISYDKVKWIMKESHIRMLLVLQEGPLRPMEISRQADYSSRNLIADFVKEAKKQKLIKEVLVDAEDRPAAVAWQLTPKGYELLHHLKEIERLNAS